MRYHVTPAQPIPKQVDEQEDVLAILKTSQDASFSIQPQDRAVACVRGPPKLTLKCRPTGRKVYINSKKVPVYRNRLSSLNLNKSAKEWTSSINNNVR